MKKMLSNKKRLLYLLCIALFLVYLISANWIMTSVIDGEHALNKFTQSIDEIPVYHEDDDDGIISYVANFITDTQLMRIAFNGYAFLKGEAGEDNERSIKILIIGEDGSTYYSNAMLYTRVSNIRHINEIGQTLPEGEFSFSTNFSTLLLKDGVYQVYLYVQESPKLYGMKNTGITFEKKTGELVWLTED